MVDRPVRRSFSEGGKNQRSKTLVQSASWRTNLRSPPVRRSLGDGGKTALPKEGQPTRVVAGRKAQARPAVEVEVVVARVQEERVPGAPPLVGGEVKTRR